jgi:hypothetical protein
MPTNSAVEKKRSAMAYNHQVSAAFQLFLRRRQYAQTHGQDVSRETSWPVKSADLYAI